MRKGEKNQEVSKIQVFARCRPLNGIERKQDSFSVVDVIQKEKKVVVRDRNKEFTFDKVFPPDVKQIDVYKSVAAPLIQEVLKGFNCTILAYGQTGTGKTYTMEGERRNNAKYSWEDDPEAGLIPRSLHQLFEELNQEDNVEFAVRVSFLELYNEELIDLLSSKDLIKLRIYENTSKKGSVHIDGLEEVVVNSKDEVYAILEKGTARRQTAATLLNASSSRSHTVFSVTVHIKENTVDGEELVKTGKLNLVDLAGSECVGRSGCINQRFREASNINMSLLTLGRVITALIENQPHVPYRESKLTRLLQDSLGGHTKTSFIATISPAQCNLEETLSTLDYATKAKNITNKPVLNEKRTIRAHIRELTEEIERLRKELLATRNGEGYYVDALNYEQMEKQIAETQNKIKVKEEELEALKQQNVEIELLLTQIKEELHKKTKQHEETVSKLTDTLCHTEKVLSKTALERDEKNYLLNIHHHKEKQLVVQNQELHHVVDESTCDVNKLHMKVERKQKVEISNEERLKQFQQVSHKQFANLDDMVNSLKQKQETKFGNLQESLDGISSDIKSSFQQATDIFHRVDSNVRSSLNDFSSVLNNEAVEQQKISNSLLENLNSKKNTLKAEQDLFCSENIPTFAEKFSGMMVEMKSWFLTNHYHMSQKIENFHKQMKDHKEEGSKFMNDVISTIDTIRESHNNELAALEEQINILSSRQSQTEKLTKICELSKLICELTSDVSKDLSLQKEMNSSIMTRHQNHKLNLESDLIATKKSLQKHLDTLEPENASSLGALDEIATTIKTNEFTSRLDTVVSYCDSEISEVATFIKNNQQKQESSFEMIKDEVVANEIITQSNYESRKTNLKEIQDSVSDAIKCDILHLDDHKVNILKKMSGAETIINASRQNLQDDSQKVSKEILQRDLAIEKFITEDLEKDIPTGTTPQRKEYYYSKDLITLSPDDEKLRILRKFRDEHTNKAVNLPMDCSFDESDEVRSPFNLAFPEVITTESALNDGDEYSTDCDTLSNASSMSDLSVTGLKNKENVKTFPKPSLKRPKVKKTKKMLKESSIPTPTQRKPLSTSNPSLFT
ncbi:kinesin-like protein KIF11-B [Parasteatoda tepidariorum]|nr:kinesin-like protein KIF11-B [Parasteatoda tepidariorum]